MGASGAGSGTFGEIDEKAGEERGERTLGEDIGEVPTAEGGCTETGDAGAIGSEGDRDTCTKHSKGGAAGFSGEECKEGEQDGLLGDARMLEVEDVEEIEMGEGPIAVETCSSSSEAVRCPKDVSTR